MNVELVRVKCIFEHYDFSRTYLPVVFHLKYASTSCSSDPKLYFVFSFLQEGPHSTLPEDEFFDAVESGLDKIEEDRQLRVRLRLQSQQVNLHHSSSHTAINQFHFSVSN